MAHLKAKQLTLSAKGDLIVGGTDGIASLLPIGTNNQVLMVENGTAVWKNPGTQYSLSGLNDVSFGTLSDGQILSYDGTTSKWVNISHSFTYNDGVRVSDSKFDDRGGGSAIEVGYDNTSDWSVIQSYDRTNSEWKPLKIRTKTFHVQTNGFDRFNIDENGNVGVGRTPTNFRFEVAGVGTTSEGVGIADSAGNLRLYAVGSSSGSKIGTTNVLPLIFDIASSEVGRFHLNGNFGLGSTNPDAKLTVNDGTRTIQARIGSLVPGNSNYVRFQARNTADDNNYYSDIKIDPDAASFVFSSPGTNASNIRDVLTLRGATVGFDAWRAFGNEYTTDLNSLSSSVTGSIAPIVSGFQPDNRPATNYSTGVYLSHSAGGAGYGTQIVTGAETTPRIFVRQFAGGSWGSWAQTVMQQSDGRVGIGTLTPETTVDIVSSDVVTIRASTTTASKRARLELRGLGSNGSSVATIFLDAVPEGAGAAASASISTRASDGNMNEHVTVTSTGRVGIGVTDPEDKTEIAGNLRLTARSWKTGTARSAGRLGFHSGGSTAERTTPVASIEGWDEYITGGGYAGSLRFYTQNTSGSLERMRIDQTGDVSIGGTNMTAKFNVVSNGPGMIVKSSDTTNFSALELGTKTGNGYTYLQSFSNGSGTLLPMTFWMGTNESFRVNTDGDILIGATAGSGIWTGASINTGIGLRKSSNPGIGVQANTNNCIWLSKASGYTSGNYIGMYVNNVQVGMISTNGTTTSYGTTSDYRLKTNLEKLSNAITRLMQLNVYRFNWISDPEGPKVDGFLAHEAQEVVAESVTGEKDQVETIVNPALGNILIDEEIVASDVPESDLSKYENGVWVETVAETTETKIVPQNIDQSKLVPLLTAALQEAIEEIRELKQRVEELENRTTTE